MPLLASLLSSASSIFCFTRSLLVMSSSAVNCAVLALTVSSIAGWMILVS